MIGRGRMVLLTRRLPSKKARAFSDKLKALTGCELAWHKTRCLYVVYSSRGKYAAFEKSYCDIGNEHLPFNSTLLRSIVSQINTAEAMIRQDPDRMLDEYNRRQRDIAADENRRYVDERFPEYYQDMVRLEEIIKSGRRRAPKFHDMGALN